MKKIWMIFCFSLLFCSTVFFGCENKENQSEEMLRIANWEEYLDEGGWDEDETIDLDEKTKILGRENMVDDFESWYEKTYGEKVRVEYSTFGTNEDLYNQMTLGDTFDLVCPSEYMIMKLMKEKKLEPFSEDFFDASKKEKKMPLLRRKIERRHEKETMRAAEKMRRTAAWKSTAKDNFSGGKKSF